MQKSTLKSVFGSIRPFHRSRRVAFPRQKSTPAPPLLQKTGMLFDEDPDADTEPDYNEGTSAGHLYLRQQRQLLNIMRLIENDMPNLVRTLCRVCVLVKKIVLTACCSCVFF